MGFVNRRKSHLARLSRASELTAYAVELLVGTTSVASDTALRPAAGTFALDTVTYNSSSSPGSGHLFIRLSAGGGGQADFAQVTLIAASLTTTQSGIGAISITNAGFDIDVLSCAAGLQCFDYAVPGWTVVGQVSTFKPSTGPGGVFPGGVPGGLNVAVLGNPAGAGVITQDLGFAPLANTRYTLTVSVGQRADLPLTAYAVELLVGTTSVASDTTLRPAAGTFALDTVTYNSGSSPGTGHLIIRLTGSGGGQAAFAQVALNATSLAQTFTMLIFCTSTGQTCVPVFSTPVTVAQGGPLTITVTPASAQCSNVGFVVSVDGSVVATTTFLTPGQSSGPIVSAAVTAGTHTITVQAIGTVGGCNTGGLGEWEGTLVVTGPVTTPLTLAPASMPTVTLDFAYSARAAEPRLTALAWSPAAFRRD